MPSDTIDLGLEFRGGVAAPTAEEVGNTPRAILADAGEPSVLEYPADQQTLAGAGTWDGSSRSLAVGGSGARAIVLPNAAKIGHTVEIFDLNGNAGGGTITIDPSGAATINGAATLTITTNYGARCLRYVATDTWVRMT